MSDTRDNFIPILCCDGKNCTNISEEFYCGWKGVLVNNNHYSFCAECWDKQGHKIESLLNQFCDFK